MSVDRTSWWWRKGRIYLGVFVVLLVTSLALDPLQRLAWQETRARQPELQLQDLGDSVSQGMLLGVLGGFRNILADFVWIREYLAWEQRDLPTTEALIHLSATLDPNMLMFWDNGAGELARDVPAWFREQNPPPNTEEMAQINRVQAKRGLELLDRGLRFHPHNFLLLFEKALIFQRLADDPDQPAQVRHTSALLTAKLFHDSALAPHSPTYAATIYLRKAADLNHGEEAYRFLRQIYPALSPETTEAERALLYEWIRGAEAYLKIPPEQQMPGHPPPNYLPNKEMGDLPGLTSPLVSSPYP